MFPMRAMATSSRDLRRPARIPLHREAVSVQDAAELLDVHEMTIRRLIAAGKLAAFRVGRLIKIRRDVLAAFSRARHDAR